MCALLTERSQSEKTTYYLMPIIDTGKSKTMETTGDQGLPGVGGGVGGWQGGVEG